MREMKELYEEAITEILLENIMEIQILEESIKNEATTLSIFISNKIALDKSKSIKIVQALIQKFEKYIETLIPNNDNIHTPIPSNIELHKSEGKPSVITATIKGNDKSLYLFKTWIISKSKYKNVIRVGKFEIYNNIKNKINSLRLNSKEGRIKLIFDWLDKEYGKYTRNESVMVDNYNIILAINNYLLYIDRLINSANTANKYVNDIILRKAFKNMKDDATKDPSGKVHPFCSELLKIYEASKVVRV